MKAHVTIASELRPCFTSGFGLGDRCQCRGRQRGRWNRWISALRALLIPNRGEGPLRPPSRDMVRQGAMHPALSRNFVGRDHLIDQVLRSLPNNSLFLSGAPGIGKTALLDQIERRVAGLHDATWEFYPIPVSLEGVAESRFFCCLGEAVERALAVQLSGVRPLLRPKLGEGLDSRGFVHELRKVIRILDCQTSKKVKLVFLVDEIDRLNHFDPLINQRLRSLFMAGLGEHLVALAAGVRINREWERAGSPWFNFFEEIEVGPLEPSEAEQLVAAATCGLLVLDREGFDRILELGGGRADLLLGLCERLAAMAREGGRRHPTVSDVDQAARDLRKRRDESG